MGSAERNNLEATSETVNPEYKLEDLPDIRQRLEDSYERVKDGSTEIDDYKALAFDITIAEKALKQLEDVVRMELNKEKDDYFEIHKLYITANLESQDGKLPGADQIEEFRRIYEDSENFVLNNIEYR